MTDPVVSTRKPAIAFIGLGQMGCPMARNLLKAGYALTGFDTQAAAYASFADLPTFRSSASAVEAVRNSEVVILMLPDSLIVDHLLWGDANAKGLASELKRGQTLIDMGSSDPVHSRNNFAKLAELGISFIDAPVSGGVKRANDASLSIMIGGLAEQVALAMPLFQAMGKNLVHVGSAGAGHAVKALNNYVSASGLLAVCEALVAAEKFGIDPHLVNQVFNTSTGKNNTTDVKVENFMLSEKYNSGFSMALMRKDLQTALSFIERMGTPQAFADQCVSTWSEADATLGKGADHTAMHKFIREQK